MVIIALTTFLAQTLSAAACQELPVLAFSFFFLPIKTSNQALNHWSGNTRRPWFKQRPLSAPSERFLEKLAALSMINPPIKVKKSTDETSFNKRINTEKPFGWSSLVFPQIIVTDEVLGGMSLQRRGKYSQCCPKQWPFEKENKNKCV